MGNLIKVPSPNWHSDNMMVLNYHPTSVSVGVPFAGPLCWCLPHTIWPYGRVSQRPSGCVQHTGRPCRDGKVSAQFDSLFHTTLLCWVKLFGLFSRTHHKNLKFTGMNIYEKCFTNTCLGLRFVQKVFVTNSPCIAWENTVWSAIITSNEISRIVYLHALITHMKFHACWFILYRLLFRIESLCITATSYESRNVLNDRQFCMLNCL